MPDTGDTSWENVAPWYGGVINDPDSYQRKVVLPNLLRAMGDLSGKRVLDIACGPGLFSAAFASRGAEVTGVDASPALIEEAKRRVPGARFFVTDAARMAMIEPQDFDVATIVLALQNIKEGDAALGEAARALAPGGRLFLVLNHPAFRIPKASSWGFANSENTQYRRVDSYLSESSEKIDMTPGTADKSKKAYTMSFHRPLQWYAKTFGKHGLAIVRLEEWISHRKSQRGPRQAAEDRARKEIPLFLLVEAAMLH